MTALPASNQRAIFLTDETPFPPIDGRKVPVANYAWQLRDRGYQVDVLTVDKAASTDRQVSQLGELWHRLKPYGGFFTRESLSQQNRQIIASSGDTTLYVSPARLMTLARKCKRENPRLKVVLILNDAQWSQYLEALYYGLGLYKGGTRNDFKKGMFFPSTLIRELTAYSDADVILLQTRRELYRLPHLRKKAVIAPNALEEPRVTWSGAQSCTFAAQVNFSNRRASKLKPFVTEIWPQILAVEPKCKLELFGPGSVAPAWVEQTPNVQFVGLVDDLNAYLSQNRGVLVPLEHSTGISNSVLRGIALDLPMVMTHSSSLGIREIIDPWPGEHAKVAKTGKEFVRHVLDLLTLPHTPQPRKIGSWSENTDRILNRIAQQATPHAAKP